MLRLIQCDIGIPQDRLRQLIGGVGQLPFHAFLLGAEGGGIVNRIAQHHCRADDRIALITQSAHGAHHNVLNLGISQMRRTADRAGVLAVALPDDFAVLVVGMPDLGAVSAAAVSAVNHAGENVHSAVTVIPGLARRHLLLHEVEGFRADDRFMVAFHVILRYNTRGSLKN